MIKNIAVLGAGTMGHGIAESFALHGYKVSLYEPYEPIRNAAMGEIKDELESMAELEYIKGEEIQKTLENITLFADLKSAVIDADYVIEAVLENMELKQRIFGELDGYCRKETIFASNTSSLKLNDIAAAVNPERYKRMMICHWYNPAHLMPLVEMSFYGNMPEDIYKEVEDLYDSIGKHTVKVLKDVPGMVANRLQHGLVRQAFSLIDEGICEPEDVDKALKYSSAFRYVTTGLLEAADMGGLDIWYLAHRNILPFIAQNTTPSPILKQKMDEGKLGLKSGEGFFKYSPQQAARAKHEFHKRLIIQLKTLKNME